MTLGPGTSPSRCRFCDHDNPGGARFCNACGSPLHLKPCPRCEAVNDTAAAQCYECGTSLETGVASSISVEAKTSLIAAAPTDDETRHVPESFGERLEDLLPMEGHVDATAAERREAFARSHRTSGALFFAVAVLVVGAAGYYIYERWAGHDSDVAIVASSAEGENQESPAQPQRLGAAPVSEATSQRAPAAESANVPSVATTSAAEPTVDAPTTTPPAAIASAAPSKAAPPDKAVAHSRQAAARPSNKPDVVPYSQPAAPSEASAAATKRMIERELGIRIAPSTTAR